MMKNIMIDLETFSLSSFAPIVSIGAVAFNMDGILKDDLTGEEMTFYRAIEISSLSKYKIDGSTLTWWLRQKDETIKALVKNTVPIKKALEDFSEWFPGGNVQVWGNGAVFDNVILSNSFKREGIEKPWDYKSDRCFRTVSASFPNIKIPDQGLAHNALDDAMWQTKYLLELCKRNNLSRMI